MKMNHFLSIADYSEPELMHILDVAKQLKAELKAGGNLDPCRKNTCSGFPKSQPAHPRLFRDRNAPAGRLCLLPRSG